MKRHTATIARSIPATGIFALACLGLTAGLGGADASSGRALPRGLAQGQQIAPESGSPPQPVDLVLIPAQSGNPLSGVARAPIFTGRVVRAPAPQSALPSRSMHTSLTSVRRLVTGGQSDVLPPASQALSARAIVLMFSSATSVATAQGSQPDSPPFVESTHGTAVGSLTGLSQAAWMSQLPGSSQTRSVVFQTPQDLTARPASLRLERIVDSQNLASTAPVTVLIQPNDPTRDFVAAAQRPAAAAGLKLSGVHPQDTSYQQPATATPTATATIVEPTSTPYVPPTIAPSATATLVPAIPTDSPTPVHVSSVFTGSKAPATATWVPSPVETATESPINTITPSPVPVLQPTDTPVAPAAAMPGNAQYFHITGYVATGNRTASGAWPQVGRTVAVDPSLIPLGSTVYIQGLGVFVAEDTGGGVLGRHVDVFVGSYADAYAITGERLVSWTPPR